MIRGLIGNRDMLSGELLQGSGICVQLEGLLMLRPVLLNQGTSEVVGLKASF